MATTKRLIKDLKDTKNIDLVQVLKSFIYDDRQLSVYKSGVAYNKRDIVIKFEDGINRFFTYRCIVNRSATTWVANEWQKETAINTIFNIEDKLIISSTTKPTDVNNKLWFRESKAFSNGTKSVFANIKDGNGVYTELYTATVTENVFLNAERTENLFNKLNVMDTERTRIRNSYLMDTLDLLFDLGAITPSAKTQKFIHIIDVSDVNSITVSGNVNRVNGIISI